MLVISHRGASGYAPENTLKAFELAVKMGSRNFEFDLHLSKDGKLIVHHEYDLKWTAGQDLKIADLTYEELKKINVAAHFKAGSQFQSAPLLEEVMEILSPAADMINFEIKNDGNVYPGIEEKALNFIASKRGMAEKSLISSFYYGTLQRLRELDNTIKLGYLGHKLDTASLLPAIAQAKTVGAVNFHPSLEFAVAKNLTLIKKAGFIIFVYTANTKKDALRMQESGVDGIFSNFPDIMEKG